MREDVRWQKKQGGVGGRWETRGKQRGHSLEVRCGRSREVVSRR